MYLLKPNKIQTRDCSKVKVPSPETQVGKHSKTWLLNGLWGIGYIGKRLLVMAAKGAGVMGSNLSGVG